jgi:acid phosphatase
MCANIRYGISMWRAGVCVLVCLVAGAGLLLPAGTGNGIGLFSSYAHAETQARMRATPRSVLPRPDHIVIIIEENKGFHDVFSSECPLNSGKPCAPYIALLAAQGASLEQCFALHHPSQPNYIELFSGSNHGIIDDCCPLEKCQPQDICRTDCDQPPSKPVLNGPSLVGMLLDKNKSLPPNSKPFTFVGYAEDLPQNKMACCSTEPGAHYARKHCPWLDFLDVPEINVDGTPTTWKFDRDFWMHKEDVQRFSVLPTISFVIPNLINDMHSLQEHAPKKTWLEGHDPLKRKEVLGRLVNQGDVWLKTYLADYVEYVMKEENNSLLIITWDEDSGGKNCTHPCPTLPPTNRIPTIFVGAKVKPGYRSKVQYTHYNLLRTILDMYDLPLIGGSQHAKPITDIWE